jgi:hypothetical protein
VHLARVIDHPNIEAGAHSHPSDFGEVIDRARHLAPCLYPGAPERLVIARFAQIAHGARFIPALANHPKCGTSTYPFAIVQPEALGAHAAEVAATGDTIIGPDVWIGHGALISPGVRVGAGRGVGAGGRGLRCRTSKRGGDWNARGARREDRLAPPAGRRQAGAACGAKTGGRRLRGWEWQVRCRQGACLARVRAGAQ